VLASFPCCGCGCGGIFAFTFGGLWAVILTDFAQFVVQLVAGLVMLVAVLARLGGPGSLFGFWQDLPAANRQLFNEPYTAGFALAFLFINFLSYNGGTWNLATRYISSPDEQQARRAAWLSGGLYLLWPLILFVPMWAAPLLLPGLAEPSQSYGLLTMELLPIGLVGLVVGLPVAVAFTIYAATGWLQRRRPVPARVTALFAALARP
jgi:Na+/proline symporter